MPSPDLRIRDVTLPGTNPAIEKLETELVDPNAPLQGQEFYEMRLFEEDNPLGTRHGVLQIHAQPFYNLVAKHFPLYLQNNMGIIGSSVDQIRDSLTGMKDTGSVVLPQVLNQVGVRLCLQLVDLGFI